MVLGEEEETSRCFGACLNLNKQQTTHSNGQKILRKVCAGKRLTKEEASIYLQLFAAPGQAEARARRDVGIGTSDGAEKDFVDDEEMFQLMERSLERAKAMLRKRVAEVVERDEIHKKMQLELKKLEIRCQDAQHQITESQGRNHDILVDLSKKKEENVALKGELLARQREVIDSQGRNHEILENLSKKEEENATLKGELSTRQREIIECQARNRVILEDLSKKEKENAALKAELLARQRDIIDSQGRNQDILNDLSTKEEENAALKAELSARQREIIDSQGRNQDILNELSKNEKKNAALKAELSARHRDIIDSQGRNQDILNDLSTKEEENAALKAELSARQREIIDSQGRNQDILNELSKKEKENAALKAQLSARHREIIDSQGRNQDILNDLSEKEEENSALKAELSARQREIIDSHGRNQDILNELSKKEKENAALKAELSTCHGEIIDSQGRNQDILNDLSKKEEDISALKAELSARQREIIDSQSRNHDILKHLSKKEKENAVLKTQLSVRQREIMDSQDRNQYLFKYLSKKEEEYAALKTELSACQRQIIDSQGRNHEFFKELSKKEQQNAALKAELSTLHEQYNDNYICTLREQKTAIITLTTEKEQLLEEVARLQRANSELISELEERRNGSNRLQVGLDDFNLLKLIGRGAYGKVLLVEEKMTSRLHAMKVIKKERATRQEIENEKDVMKLAKDCPFLISMRYCFQTTTRVIFVMEYASGGDMLTHLQKRNRLPEEHVKFYGAEIVVAVNFLHERGVAYRDLKLDNILIDHEGHLKLADFGLCKNELQDGMLMKTFCGTPKNIAPEMLKGRQYGFSVDWWAVGITLYELITGYPPFYRETDYLTYEDILYKDVQLEDWISIEASALILGFLIKNPEHRLGSNRQWGFLSITSHRFFSGIDWDKVAQKELQPPYKPSLTSSQDVGNFDPQFTNQSVGITPDNSLVEDESTEQFTGFEYTVSGHRSRRSPQSVAQEFGTKPPPVPGAHIY